ncbi:MAG: hypothetical protein HXX13_07705 [Bacteroidetes bacterium]|nr:hypothetical protein [Bacteroidota bacterium]
MKRHRLLFEKHQQGTLDENGIKILDQLLVDMYFRQQDELSPAEIEYAEDLIIELISAGGLKEEYAESFRITLSNNSSLTRKFRLLEEVKSGTEKARDQQIFQLISNENPELEKQEEEQLSRIVREAIEKVHKEEETQTAGSFLGKVLNGLGSYLDNLLPGVPNLRPVLAIAGILLIAAIFWISVKPGQKPMISKVNPKDTVSGQAKNDRDSIKGKSRELIKVQPSLLKDKQLANIDSAKIFHRKTKVLHKNRLKIKPSVSSPELDRTLLALADDVPSELDYTEVRSETSEGYDLFVDAADKYNKKDYNGTILLMNKLVRGRYFTSGDTLNTLYFYLGNSYLTKGFEKPAAKLLKSALANYSKVSENSIYYKDARWYSALVFVKLGEKNKGLKILDSLLHDQYLRSGNVLKFKQLLKGQ